MVTELTACFHSLIEEHGHLSEEIGDLRRWWQEVADLGKPRFGEMAHRVRTLQRSLERHFEQEELGGYLGNVLECFPEMAEEVGLLHDQHEQFSKTLRSLVSRLESETPPFESWQHAGREFEGFLAELSRHESRENAALQSTHNCVSLHDDGLRQDSMNRRFSPR